MFRVRTQSDAATVRAVLAGDREAFALLVERYERAVKGVALASSRNFHEAEDIAQEAFLRAFRDLRSLRRPERFAPWIVQIARNIAVDHARRAARHAPEVPEPEASCTPAELELHQLLRDEVMRLPDAFREAVVLHHFSGKTASEVGQLLGITRAAAHKRIQRGRAELSAGMEKHLHEALRDPQPRGALVGAVMLAVAGVSIAGRATASPAAYAATGGAMTGLALGKLAAICLVFLFGGLAAWWVGREQIAELKSLVTSPATSQSTSPAKHLRPELQAPRRMYTPDASQTIAGGKPSVPTQDIPAPDEPSIAGRVADVQGRPITGATIVGYSTDGFHAEAATDDQGQYRMDWLGEREYTLRARAPGFFPASRTVTAPARADFRLEAGPLIACRLLDQDTRLPVAGASVRMRSAESLSNASGHVDLAPPAAAYVAFEGETVDIEAAGYRNEHLPAEEVLPGQPGERLDLFLEPLSIVRGVVVTTSGDPISAVEVYALEPAFDRVAQTDESGRFEVLHLEAWPSALYFSRFPIYQYNAEAATDEQLLRESRALGIAQLELPEKPATKILEHRIVIKGGASLRGRILINGRPPAEADTTYPPLLWITFEPDDNPATVPGILEIGAQLQQSITGAEYEFPLLPPGKARVALSYGERWQPGGTGRATFREIVKHVTLVDGVSSVVDFSDDKVRLFGNVQFQQKPCGEGSLHIQASNGITSDDVSVRISSEGRFEVSALAGADMNLRVGAVTPDGLVRFKKLAGIALPASGEVQLDIDLSDAEIAKQD